MSITFVHTGDWHIGKPFGRFETDTGGVLRRARLEAIDRVAAAARDSGAGVVLVAGDVYDRPDLSERDMREPIARMRAYGDIAWHLIPGNHDPAEAGGIWQRVLREGLASNVHVHLTPEPVPLGSDAWLLPAPLGSRAVSEDPTAGMAAATTPAGGIRIGLAHGSIQGFGSEGAASVRIAPDRDKLAGLDYLALGDWHGVKRIGERVWYAGTPEPDGFLDNEPGHALVVEIGGPTASARVQRIATGQFRWLSRTIESGRPTDTAELCREIADLGPAARHVLLEVRARGRITAAEDTTLTGTLDALDAQVFHLSRRLEELNLVPGADDLDSLGDGSLRALAAELAVAASSGEGRQAAVSERALRRLFELAENAK